MSLLILVVDDEPDVETLFRQQFRRDLRSGRFTMEFAQSAPVALQRITDAAGVSLILILSDINMPEMSGLDLLPKAKALRPDRSGRFTMEFAQSAPVVPPAPSRRDLKPRKETMSGTWRSRLVWSTTRFQGKADFGRSSAPAHL
jgi:CheY-like chemotaxis protein